MLNMSFAELLVVLVFAFLILGPNEVGKVARFLGKLVRKSSKYLEQIKEYVNEEVKEAGAEDLKETIAEVKSKTEEAAGPLHELKKELDRDAKTVEQLKKLK